MHVRIAPVRSQHVVPQDTSQQWSEVDAAAAVADSDALKSSLLARRQTGRVLTAAAAVFFLTYTQQ